MVVLYGSQTGTCKALAENLCAALRARHSGKQVAPAQHGRLGRRGPGQGARGGGSGVHVVSSRCAHRRQVLHRVDERGAVEFNCKVNDKFLQRLCFDVLGVSDSAYANQGHFNRVGKALNGDLLLLGAAPLMPLSLGDVSGSVDAAFSRWRTSTTC